MFFGDLLLFLSFPIFLCFYWPGSAELLGDFYLTLGLTISGFPGMCSNLVLLFCLANQILFFVQNALSKT